jgi:hypothetical protein
MANNRIGCSSGKTKLIDPNNFYGQDSSNNMSVPLEDLTISVQLTTMKKGRTVLSSNIDTNTAQSSNTVKVTFIEGTEVNGEKVLTSKFTDLTTVFDKDTPSSSENLGITNIDIDFNSSYAPMITINFIDLRGSSIFQNESQLNNHENKYSVFFQLPYPLYELTIKGYYGKPVKYCLHMTKFNSKFNSQTGNFEITANFIGYTYAMLSDMLLGILKAIPYTERGVEKYKDVKTLNLNDLMIKIGQIDSNLSKIGTNDPDAAKYKNIDDGLEYIQLIKNDINQLGQIDVKTDLSGEDAYQYIVTTAYSTSSNDEKKKVGGLKTVYNQNITNNIAKYNTAIKNLDSPIEATEFITSSKLIKYYPLKTFINPDDITNKVISRKTEIGNNFKFDVMDMSKLFAILNKRRNLLEKEKKKTQLKLGETIKKNITNALSFQPTVRNIVEVFTNAVEVFLSIIYDVSKAAENHPERDKELKKAFKQNGNSDLKQSVKFYPWPDYRDNDAQNGYVEKYLGTPGVLNDPTLVNELVFIDDLYMAFLKAKKISDEALLEQEQQNLWVPTNPFDTKIYNNKEPYDRLDNTSLPSDVINLMLIRMITFMGYTHDPTLIDNDAIVTMATADANAFIKNKTISNSVKLNIQTIFGNVTQADITSVTTKVGTINGKGERVLIKDNYNYYYDYIISQNTDTNIKAIPISDTFIGDWPKKVDDLQSKKVDDGSVFLTNYTRNKNEGIRPKPLDGGRYIDIISIDTYNSTNNDGVIGDVGETNDTVSYKALVKADKSSYSIFNGPYGMQDFKYMDYNSDKNSFRESMKKSPLMYLFYAEYNIYEKDSVNSQTNLSNFISYGRNKKAPKPFKYDFENDKPYVYNPKTRNFGLDELKKMENPNKPLHSTEDNQNVYSNRYMLTLDKNGLSYPYIELLLNTAGFDAGEVRLSLFGSKLYYRQKNSSPKINDAEFKKSFLFLNTLPFNEKLFDGTSDDELIHLFDKTGGFIHAPRLWCAWVGSLVWRSGMSSKNLKTDANWVDPIDYPTDPTIVSKPSFYTPIKRYEFFRNALVINKATISSANFIGGNPHLYSDLFIYLPQQVLDTFYSEFENFVEGKDVYISWEEIKSNLELVNIINKNTNTTDYNKTYDRFLDRVNQIYTTAYVGDSNGKYINKSLFDDFDNTVLDNYAIITPIPNFSKLVDDKLHNDGLFLELKGNYSTNDGIKYIIDALTEETIIVNSGFGAWSVSDKFNAQGVRQKIQTSESNVKVYLNKMKDIISAANFDKNAITKQNKQEVFGTDNTDIIKLQLYRTCKNVYDKWVGYAPNGENVIFQCGGGKTRHTTDTHMAEKRTKKSGITPKLIDSFRFVTRSFRDIGDDFFVDPRPIGTYLTDNPNSSFYDAITNLLAANNFDFIALPSFINYNDKKTLESIFDTYTYEEAIKDGICGPSFVCVYIGQKSKHLDFQGSEYDNDGFDVQCIGGAIKEGLPKDFKTDSKSHENDVAVFKVAYSQQNQNIFKDIILDQSEFTETEESLKIIDDISKTGSENQRHFGGQNLYSVYGVRSYKTEVEMMGNAMIQPMMYFQLDNIPMFHGAYLITHVKHSIKPNYMSTNFTGVRVRSPETPILDAAELYMSLLENIEITATNTTGSAVATKTIAELAPLINAKQFADNKNKKYIKY